MPNWKKLVTSGSDASFNSINVSTFVSASSFIGDGSGLTDLPSQTIDLSEVDQHIIPQADNTYDLGSPTKQWRDLYLSSASLYIDGTKVISSDSNTLTFTTDVGQSIKLLETGGDDITLQTDTGNIELKGTVEIESGKKITDSAATMINFGDSIAVTGSILTTGTVDGIDLQAFSSSVAAGFANTTADYTELTNIPAGIISSSAQIASDISGSFTSISASIASDIAGISTDWESITSKPAGIVSGSSQITITESQISDLTYYTDSDVKTKLDNEGVISGSSQVIITKSQISDVTATAAELNYVDGVTSNIQTQLDSKQEAGSYITTTSSQALSSATNALTFAGNVLTLTRGDGSTDTINLSAYLDDTNLARVISGTYDSGNQELVFTRDDASTFTIDASMFFDDTNLVTSVNAGSGISVNQTTGGITVTNSAPNVSTNLSTTANSTSLTINSSDGTNASIPAATTSAWGAMTDEDKSKLDGIAASANNYVHPNYAGDDINIDTGVLTGATVISDLDFNITTDTNGHVSDANGTFSTRTLTLSDLGYTGATNANNYVHPSYAGDDINVDTGALTGATVVSDIDFNITTDTLGHVTDANGVVSTRTLTLANLGYTGATNANYITNNNQLTNGAGYITDDLTSDLNLQYSGNTYSNAIKFQGAAASTYEIGIRANGEGLEIFEPEDANKVWLTIADDPSGNAAALQVNSAGGMTPVITNYNKGSYITKAYIDGLNVDSDTLDGLNSTQFLRRDTSDTMTGYLTLSNSGQGWIKGYDDYHSIKFRAGSDNKTEYYEYGGTLAAGLGHKFFTGGTTGQTLKFQVADDGSYFSGKVGIGTTAPSAFLHLKGGMSYGSFRISPSIANGESAMAFFTDVAGTTTSNAWVIGHAGWGHTGDFVIGNQANGGPVMLMQQNGNVGIGTTSPSSKLEVYGSGSTVLDIQGSQGQLFSVTDNLTGTLFTVSDISGIPILEVDASGTVTVDGELDVTGNQTVEGILTVQGEIRGQADIIAYHSSDERLKENITPIENATDKVKQIGGYTFDWKSDIENITSRSGNDIGLIAQEVEKVVPQVVTTRTNGYKGVDYQKLVALLIESNKELASRIEELEKKLQ